MTKVVKNEGYLKLGFLKIGATKNQVYAVFNNFGENPKGGPTKNQDYASFDNIIKREKGATVRKEYALTIDAA